MRTVVYNLNSIRPPITGIGRYAIELIRTGLRSGHDIHAFVEGEIQGGQNLVDALELLDVIQLQHNLRAKQLIGRLPYTRQIYRKLQFTAYSRKLKQADITHFISHDLNYSDPKANVVTAYDVSHIICPETHPKHRVRFLHKYFNEIKCNGSQIVTISQHVKDELISHYHLSPDRVTVTHLAADSAFRPRCKRACQGFLSNTHLEHKQFVLCLATREPRKNLASCIKAYANLPSRLRNQFPLAIAGPTGWKAQDLNRQINYLEARGEIVNLGFVDQSELPLLYSSAAVFMFPSLYEGFGLPLLEAMQSGCASITSANGALAEVSNHAAIQIDPVDIDSLTNSLAYLLENPDHRVRLEQSGIERAGDFSWKNTVERTFKVYESI